MAIHSFLIITKILVYSQYFIICLYIIYALPFFFFFLKPNLSIGFTLQFDSSASGCAHSVSLQFHSLPQAQYSYSQNHCLFFIPILKIPRFCFMLSFFFKKYFFSTKFVGCVLQSQEDIVAIFFPTLFIFFLFCFGVLQ